MNSLSISLAVLNRLNVALRRKATLLGQVGWVGGSFVAQQVLRLATNIALAWLLAPALLGTMLLINTLRTGGELLTDVGIGQSIVNSPRGVEPDFFNTAWTMKIIRGFVLFALALAATVPLSGLYGDPQLRILLPVSATIFVISGFASPSRALLQKQMEVRRIALFDLAVTFAGLFIHVVLALISPTIWALVGGLLLSTSMSTIGSFFLLRGRPHGLRLERDAIKEIVHFGKWIFFASLVYFLSMHFDRLYFADALSFALLGIYGIARTFSTTITEVFQRIGTMLVFPKISATTLRGAELRAVVKPLRLLVLLCTATALSLAVTFADIFIDLVYDDRYRPAGIFLTILLFGSWFAILSALSDAIILGVSQPSGVAVSNLVKLIAIAAALPFILPRFGIAAALTAFVVAEALRYGVLISCKRAIGLGFTRQDLAMTGLFVILAFVLRGVSGLLGLTSGVSGWLEAATAL